MSAKQFGHFLNLQRRLAGINSSPRRVVRPEPKPHRATGSAVAAAKLWLAEAARVR